MKQPLVPIVEQLAPHCWRLLNHGFSMNTGLIVGQDRAAVIDTGSGPREAAGLYAAIRKITDLPCLWSTPMPTATTSLATAILPPRACENSMPVPRPSSTCAATARPSASWCASWNPKWPCARATTRASWCPAHIVAESGRNAGSGRARRCRSLAWAPGTPPGTCWCAAAGSCSPATWSRRAGRRTSRTPTPTAGPELLGRLVRECGEDVRDRARARKPGGHGIRGPATPGNACRNPWRAKRSCAPGRPAASTPPPTSWNCCPTARNSQSIFLQRLREIMP